MMANPVARVGYGHGPILIARVGYDPKGFPELLAQKGLFLWFFTSPFTTQSLA